MLISLVAAKQIDGSHVVLRSVLYGKRQQQGAGA
jgi:hypothetical protein